MGRYHCWPKALESQSPESPTAFSESVGESKPRISNSVFPKRWRVKAPNLQQRFPKALESQSPESPTAFSQSVGESKPRISNSVFPKRWRVEVPNLKAKLRKVSGIPGKITSLAQSVFRLGVSRFPTRPFAFSDSSFIRFPFRALMFSDSLVRFPTRWPVFRLAFSDSAGGRSR